MIRILQTEIQIVEARAKLRAKKLDTSRHWRRALYWCRYLVRFRRVPEPVAVVKSWDVWTIYEALSSYVSDRNALVFEMGSYNSEIPLVLWLAGYRNIRAADFNPLGRSIRWYGNGIDFRPENFYKPDLKPGSVVAITALSVIEHGYDQARLIATAARLLAPGGVFLLTTDYREDGAIVPPNFRAFNLSYRVFNRVELESLVSDAALAGLELLEPAEWAVSDYPITWERWRFTFAFVGFRKVQ